VTLSSAAQTANFISIALWPSAVYIGVQLSEGWLLTSLDSERPDQFKRGYGSCRRHHWRFIGRNIGIAVRDSNSRMHQDFA
jgi:hypothetical protein